MNKTDIAVPAIPHTKPAMLIPLLPRVGSRAVELMPFAPKIMAKTPKTMPRIVTAKANMTLGIPRTNDATANPVVLRSPITNVLSQGAAPIQATLETYAIVHNLQKLGSLRLFLNTTILIPHAYFGL